MSEQPNRDTSYHTTVLLREAVDLLEVRPDGTYVDCTLGGGGHSREILQQLGSQGRLIAFDRDEDAGANIPADDRVLFIPQDFRHIARFLRLHKISAVDGILADLGVSSHQFDTAERGFSTRFEADLDMRMDRRTGKTAADVLNNYTQAELHKIFERYGEVTNSKTLASLIVEKRKLKALLTTADFKGSLSEAAKGNPNKYWAQVFQALRIEVNDEAGALQELLTQSVDLLKPGGRIAIISFHSLEDRLVKNFFKDGPVSEEKDDVFGHRPETPFRVITKKPMEASAEEQKINKRSRSARLRAAEKK